MKLVKSTFKRFLSKNIVLLLVAGNIMAFTFTDSVFNTLSSEETKNNKGLISKMYTGWQMLDWSFSLIDYLSDLTDGK